MSGKARGTALHEAVAAKHEAAVELLLQYRCEPYTGQCRGTTLCTPGWGVAKGCWCVSGGRPGICVPRWWQFRTLLLPQGRPLPGKHTRGDVDGPGSGESRCATDAGVGLFDR